MAALVVLRLVVSQYGLAISDPRCAERSAVVLKKPYCRLPTLRTLGTLAMYGSGASRRVWFI